jgi:hypothetical protein
MARSRRWWRSVTISSTSRPTMAAPPAIAMDQAIV